MSFKEKTVIRILLFVARLMTDKPEVAKEIDQLWAHISCGDWNKSA